MNFYIILFLAILGECVYKLPTAYCLPVLKNKIFSKNLQRMGGCCIFVGDKPIRPTHMQCIYCNHLINNKIGGG